MTLSRMSVGLLYILHLLFETVRMVIPPRDSGDTHLYILALKYLADTEQESVVKMGGTTGMNETGSDVKLESHDLKDNIDLPSNIVDSAKFVKNESYNCNADYPQGQRSYDLRNKKLSHSNIIDYLKKLCEYCTDLLETGNSHRVLQFVPLNHLYGEYKIVMFTLYTAQKM